jgi:hypothetical protein
VKLAGTQVEKTMLNQRTLRFELARKSGQLAVNHRIDEAILNHPRNIETHKKTVARCPKAEMLKRVARRAMSDVTECPPDTIGAHLARLDDLIEIFAYLIREDFAHTPESRYSGKQIGTPYTMADFLECLSITRKQHRAPAFVNQRDADIADIKRMVCTLAGLVSKNPEALELFQRQFDKAQTEEAA